MNTMLRGLNIITQKDIKHVLHILTEWGYSICFLKGKKLFGIIVFEN